MEELPEELLQHIFLQLRLPGMDEDDLIHEQNLHERLHALLNVSLTSKAFNRLVRPFIYHTVNFQTVYLDFGRLARLAHVQPLLRTLIEHPGTADLVRLLHISSWDTQHDVELGRARITVPDAEDLERYNRALDCLELHSDLKQRLRDGLIQGIEDAALALLICMCKNLCMLELMAVYGWKDTLVAAVLQNCQALHDQDDPAPQTVSAQSRASASATPRKSSLSYEHLVEVRLAHWDTENATPIADVSTFLRLPSLGTFRGWRIDCEDDAGLSRVTSLVQRVYLEESYLDSYGLEQLLTACPALELLSVHCLTSPIGDSPNITYQAFGEVLRRHGSSLKRLNLRLDGAGDDEALDGVPLGSLVHLESLEHLVVPLESLCGNELLLRQDYDEMSRDYWNTKQYLVGILPKCLKTLHVFGTDQDERIETRDDQLLTLMQGDSFCNLSWIRLTRYKSFWGNEEHTTSEVTKSSGFWQALNVVRLHDRSQWCR